MNKPLPEPVSVFDGSDDETEERALAEAEAQIAEGKSISHKAMRRWLMSWGKPDELPPPERGE